MQSKQIRLPFLSLQNQYSYLNTDAKKNNKLQQFVLELNQLNHIKKSNKLPNINHKSIYTAKKFQNKLTEIQHAISNRKGNKLERTLSTPYPYQSYSSYYFAQPYSPNLQQSPSYYPYYYYLQPTTNMQSPTNSQIEKQKQQSNKLSKCEKQQKKQQKKQQVKQQTNNKNIKQINKIPEKSTINKFRVAGYVVYFSIYFKYFSRKFTEIRKNWFHQRYSINDGKIILQGSTKILKHLHEIDLFKMISISKQRAKDLDIDNYKQPKGEKISQQILTLTNFITLLLQYINQYMTNPKFIQQHHQVFTVGVLNQNFMVTNLYLPQQASLLHIHKKGYIQIQEQTQIILLMIKIVVKILVFNFLLGLRYSRYWNSKQEKSYSLNDKDIQNIWVFARNAAIFLCIACEQIYDKTKLKIQSSQNTLNFAQLSTKFNILPSKPLQQLKQPKVNNNKDIQSKFITNLNGYKQMKYLIQQKQQLKKYKQKIQIKIINLLTNIYTSLKFQQIKIYHFIWLTTLDQQYLIIKGIKQDIKIKKNRKKIKNKNKNIVAFQTNLQQIQQDDDQSKQGTNAQSDQNNDYQNDEKDENQKGGDKKKKKKKMKFKHQQQFYDHKFLGYTKLMKLKSQMIKK